MPPSKAPRDGPRPSGDPRPLPRRLQGPREWMALVASSWAVLVGGVYWFLPTGCASSGRRCTDTTNIATHLPLWATAALVLAGIAFGLLPFLLRRTKIGPAVWGVAVLLLFVPLFGADVLLVPAAFFAILASLVPRRLSPTGPSDAGGIG